MKNNTIGFFGDSFCAEVKNHHSIYYGYKTYLSLLSAHYNLKIVNIGHGGTGVWDILINQLNPLIEKNKIPDVCVFVWPVPGRLFHRSVRRLDSADALHPKLHTYNPFKKNIWNAAKLYYNYLYDQEKEEIEYISALKYIDDEVLSKFTTNIKIIHLWSCGKTKEWSIDGIRPTNTNYPYSWKRGIEIRPSLMSVSMYDNSLDILQVDHRCNHLDGSYKNNLVFKWIREAIDNSTQVYDYSTEIDKFYDKSQGEDHRAI